MAEGSNGRRRFSDKWGKHELDVLAVLSSAFPQWLTSRQIAQRVKAYADSYGELADQAAKAAFAKQFQRDRAKLAAMGIAIESRQPEYSSKSEGQDFASYRLQLGDEPRIRLRFEQEDLPVLAAANYLARSISVSSTQSQTVTPQHVSRTTPRVPQTPSPASDWIPSPRDSARRRFRRLSCASRLPPFRGDGRRGRREHQRRLHRFRRPRHVRARTSRAVIVSPQEPSTPSTVVSRRRQT